MAITQIRQAPNPLDNLTGKPSMLRQPTNSASNLTGRPVQLRQAPNTRERLIGQPAQRRQAPNLSSQSVVQEKMLRQEPNNDVTVGGPMLRYNGTSTATPPIGGFVLPSTQLPNLQQRTRQDIQSEISKLNIAIADINSNTQEIQSILKNGEYGTDGAGGATVADGGIIYLLSDLNTKLSNNQAQSSDHQTAVQDLQGQYWLASSADPTTLGKTTTTVLRDYRHAARIFTDSNFRLSPKYGFLFYVEFDFNPLITEITNQSAQEIGMIVKSVSLPKFTIDTKIHNAYNRKNIVQNRINYDQVQITFHDDQSDNVRNFWYDYYSYFYRDPDYADSTYQSPHKYQSRPSFDWGYTPRPAVGYNSSTGVQPYQYIQAIRIYSLYQGNFSEYELVNPIITSFKHGDHSVSEGSSLLEHQMSVQFETVKYQTGYVTNNTVGGFIDLHYDNTLSPNGTNTGEQAPNTFSDTITDLANNQTSINPSLRTDNSLQSITLSPSGGFSAALGLSIGGAAGTGLNAGGFSIPSFGSLTQGVPSGAAITQQLEASAVGIAGRAASSLANGVVGSIAKGLGPNGSSIIGLAAAAISNPSAALHTAENMAIGYATRMASNYVNNAVNSAVQSISGEVSSFVSENISQPISQAFGDLTGSLSNSFGEFTSSFSFGGVDSVDTASLFSDSSAYDAGAGWSS